MRNACIAVGVVTITASLLHITSDVMEWISGGFSPTQLGINYAAFLMMPFATLGLYAVQRPKIGWSGLIGAVLYAIAFIYFAHTTLVAVENSLPNYEALWNRLGWVYTLHGGFMVAGGLIFTEASIRAGILSKGWLAVFLAGLAINLLIVFLPLPDIFQTIGSGIRNLGLIGIGAALLTTGKEKCDS